MTGRESDRIELTDHANVVRYVKPTMILDDGSVDGSEFRLRLGEIGISVNWIECFVNMEKTQQLNEVRRLSRITMRKSGRLAELNVGATKQYVRDQIEALRFINAPLPAEEDYEADPSHSEIVGLPSPESLQAAIVGDMIAEYIVDTHPAVV